MWKISRLSPGKYEVRGRTCRFIIFHTPALSGNGMQCVERYINNRAVSEIHQEAQRNEPLALRALAEWIQKQKRGAAT